MYIYTVYIYILGKYGEIKFQTRQFGVPCFRQTFIKWFGKSVMTAFKCHNIHNP